VTLTAVEIDRFEDGRLAETRTGSDTLGSLEQIGAAPTGGGGSADGRG
jgi:hypothetical protein